jgi:hypothetical protein
MRGDELLLGSTTEGNAMIHRICFLLAGLLLLASLAVTTYAQMPGTFAPMLAGGGTPTCVPWDSNTVALWHFDNNLNDSSQRGHNGTFAGAGGSLSNVQSKFGGYSYLQTAYTGAINVPASPDWNMGFSDWTLETWGYINQASFPSYSGIWGIPSNWATEIVWGGSHYLLYNGTNVNTPVTNPPVQQWFHYAWVRSGAPDSSHGGVFRVFVNGVQQGANLAGTPTYTTGDSTTAPQIGNYGANNGSYLWPGYLDEYRISKVARYTSNFTPQTVPFCNPPPVYTGPGDVASASANAWWGFRAYNKSIAGTSTPVVNLRRSADNHTCDVQTKWADGTLGNTASCSTGTDNGQAAGAFCSSQCYATKLYDQSGANGCSGAACDVSQATVANQPPVNFGCDGQLPCLTFSSSSQNLVSTTGPAQTVPFSMSFWGKRTGSFTTQQNVLYQTSNPTNLGYYAAANQVILGNAGQTQTASGATDSVPHSIAGVFDVGFGSTAVWVDGTQTTSTAGNSTATAGTLSISGTGGNPFIAGTFSEGGFFAGKTLSQANLCANQYGFAYGTACGVIPPCTANTDGGGTFANVIALWHLDSNFNDVIGTHNGTPRGQTAISSTQSKFGGGSAFIGNSTASANNFAFPIGSEFNFGAGDFTVEMWQYYTGPLPGAAMAFLSSEPDGGGDTNMVLQNYSNAITPYFYLAGLAPMPSFGASMTRPQNTWEHVVVQRRSGTVSLYENGVLIGTPQTASGNITNQTTPWIVGSYTPTAYPSYNFPGYIDEIRISNVARYSGSTITPPSAAFCNN